MSEEKTRSKIAKPKQSVDSFRNWLGAVVEKHQARYYHGEKASYRWMVRLVGFTVAVVIIGGAYLLLRLPARHLMTWRDDGVARSFFDRGDAYGATIWAEQALNLDPNDLVAATLMSQIAAKAHSQDELFWRQRVEEIDPSIPNKLALADAALRLQEAPFPTATRIGKELASSGSTNAAWQLIAGRLAESLHHPDEAEAHFVNATTLEPTNINYAVNLAAFRLSQTNEANRAEARARLLRYRTDPVSGSLALRALVADQLAAGNLTTASNFSNQLLASPGAELVDQLQYLSILRQLKSADFPAQLEAVKTAAQTNELSVVETSHWLVAHDLAAENITWLTNLPDNMLAKLPVKLALIDALEANEQWPELSGFASHGNWGDLEYFRFAEVSHAATKMNLPDVAQFNWNSAVNEATGHLQAQRRLLELADRWQLKAQTEDLLARLVRDFPEEQDAVNSLTQIYVRNGDTASLNRLFARLAPMFPTNTDYEHNLTAMKLLLKSNLFQAEKAAEDAYNRTPENPHVVVNHAYSLYLQHRYAEGIAVLKKLKADDLAKPTPALYYGLLLSSAGKPAEAAPWLKLAKSSQDSLLPEQKELLSSALARR